MYTIEINSRGDYQQSEREGWQVLLNLISSAAKATLSHQNAPTGALDILIADDETLQQLNRDYRGVSASTDVLAFPSAPGPTIPELSHHIGDIAISVEHARVQAVSSGHTLEEELQLLVVHGTLHLMGFDHQDQSDREQMWAVQAEILESLGVSPLSLP